MQRLATGLSCIFGIYGRAELKELGLPSHLPGALGLSALALVGAHALNVSP